MISVPYKNIEDKRKYEQTHPRCRNNKVYMKKYHQRPEVKKHKKEYKEDHKELIKKQLRNCFNKLRLKVIVKLGGKCANPYNLQHPDWCNGVVCLQVDHINGGGSKERRKLGFYKLYQKVLKDPTGYQLLCSNCNLLKKHNNNEVSHKGNKKNR